MRPFALLIFAISLFPASCPKRPPAVVVVKGEKYKDVQAGVRHTCGLLKDGHVRCWGDDTGPNGEDSCQTRASEGIFDELDIGAYHSCAYGTINRCWGWPDEDVKLMPIHGCFFNEEQELECFGENKDGQATPPPLVKFRTVTVGGKHTCGITLDDDLLCWGNNDYGQTTPNREPPFYFDCVDPRSDHMDDLWKDLPGDIDWGVIQLDINSMKRAKGLCDATKEQQQQYDQLARSLMETLAVEPQISDYLTAKEWIYKALLSMVVMEITLHRYYGGEYCCNDCYYMAAMGLGEAVAHREALIAKVLSNPELPVSREELRALCLPVPLEVLTRHEVTACDIRSKEEPRHEMSSFE